MNLGIVAIKKAYVKGMEAAAGMVIDDVFFLVGGSRGQTLGGSRSQTRGNQWIAIVIGSGIAVAGMVINDYCYHYSWPISITLKLNANQLP